MLCSTEQGLEEILSLELRRSGLAPVKLGSAWCVSRGAHTRMVQLYSATRVSHLFALVIDDDFEALTIAKDLATELEALLEPGALEEALDAARGKQSKAPRYDIRFSSERTLEPKLRQVVSESLRRGLKKQVPWRFDEKRPQVTLWVHWGPSSLALGLASVLSAERRNLCRLSALGLLGAEAAQGGALADPCCGHGKVLQLALRIWPKEPSRVVGQDLRQAALKTAQKTLGSVAALCPGDGGQLALQPGEADAVLCDLPNSGEPEECEQLYHRVVKEAARVLRSQGRLVLLCGQPELLAAAVVKGPWKTRGAWPMTRKAEVEQLVCLEKMEDAADRHAVEAASKEIADAPVGGAPRRSEEIKALWERLGI